MAQHQCYLIHLRLLLCLYIRGDDVHATRENQSARSTFVVPIKCLNPLSRFHVLISCFTEDMWAFSGTELPEIQYSQPISKEL